MDRKFLMQEMSWPEFEESIKNNVIIIVPIGSTEQHGLHLPLGTDALIGFEIAKRTAQHISEEVRVIVSPPINIGLSSEHMGFPGTLSFKGPESFIAYIKSVCITLALQGAKKIVLWNSHGGNTACLMAVARDVRREKRTFVLLVQWSHLARKVANDIMETKVRIHADEIETSVMLFLFPELVYMEKAIKEMPEKFVKSKHMKTLSGLPYPSWLTKDISKSGVIGDATRASKEKGKIIVEAAIKEFCELLKELATW